MREQEKFHCPICGCSFKSAVDELEHEFLCVEELKQVILEKASMAGVEDRIEQKKARIKELSES